MEWLVDLRRREERLKQRIAAFGRGGRSAHTACGRARGSDHEGCFRRYVQPEVEQMQAALADYLCGRSEDERSRMSYEVSLNLPVYSHLHNLFQLHSSDES